MIMPALKEIKESYFLVAQFHWEMDLDAEKASSSKSMPATILKESAHIYLTF